MQIIAVRLASMRVTAQKSADADMMIADAKTVRAIKTTNVSRNLESVSYAIRSRQYHDFVGGCTVAVLNDSDQSSTSNQKPGPLPLTNDAVATHLDSVADLLDAQNANPYRVRSYRSAAQLVRDLDRPVSDLLQTEGLRGLEELHGIGESLAHAIERLTFTGRLGLLDRLQGSSSPERLFQSVAGIGPEMSRRIYETLAIETLHDLELAAYDGRLRQVKGLGEKRLRGIRESLSGRFRRRPDVPESKRLKLLNDKPTVAELLDVDREYRHKAANNQLPLIAPRRFNPTGEAWLPVLHTQRGQRHYTALYSNTAHAHEMGTTHDWVIIYRDDHKGSDQWTIITSRLGADRGRRIVRGREWECSKFYRKGKQRK